MEQKRRVVRDESEEDDDRRRCGSVALALLVLRRVGWACRCSPLRSRTIRRSQRSPPRRCRCPRACPRPVERWYRTLYGDSIPVVDSVVITGRARVRPAGPVWFPARFRFTHDAGKGYRHYIEATWFGIPVIKVNERYVDGKSLMELLWTTDQGPKVEQAANLGMWAELSSGGPIGAAHRPARAVGGRSTRRPPRSSCPLGRRQRPTRFVREVRRRRPARFCDARGSPLPRRRQPREGAVDRADRRRSGRGRVSAAGDGARRPGRTSARGRTSRPRTCATTWT